MKYYKIWIWAVVAMLAISCEEDRLTEDNIFDEGTPGEDGNTTVQDGVEKVYNPYWEWVKKYPGVVPDTVKRLVDGVDVMIDANYTPLHANSRLAQYNSKTRVWFSTGLYAAPAEVITIVKPRGLQTEVKWRIGATTCKLKNEDKLQRFPNIYAEGVLSGDTTKVYNLFGGNIYLVPSEPIASPVTFQIKGAVKSPDFVLGKTDMNAWLKELQTTQVPFAEFAGKKVIWSMPTRMLKKITSADEFLKLIAFYDDVVTHDYDEYTGLSEGEKGQLHGAMDFAGRHVTDIQVCAGAAHAGYPAMYGETYGEKGVQYSVMTTASAWGFFHEFGHGYQVPVWMWSESDSKIGGGINEVSNNFHIFHSLTRLNNAWPADIVESWQNAIDRYVKVADATKNFDAPVGTVLGNVINEDKVKIIPFMQLAQKFGWRFYAYLGRTSRELAQESVDKINENAKMRRREFFCMRACEWAQKDLRPFFDAWGFKYGPFTSEEMGKLPKLDAGDKFWEVFDVSVIPSFEDKNTGSYVKLDNSAIWKSGNLDRTDWTVTASMPFVPDGATGKPEDLLDGKGDTYLSLRKPGKGSENPADKPNPIYFILDMQKAQGFDYFTLQNRTNNTAVGLRAKEVSIYGSNDGQNFTLIQNKVVMEVANNSTGNGQQKFSLGTIYTYRYVKINCDVWDTVNSTSVQISEVNLGVQ